MNTRMGQHDRAVCILVASFFFFCLEPRAWPASDSAGPADDQPKALAQLSLEQLGNIEVTTAARTPEQVWNTSAAIYVITQYEIQCSGATNIPEALRLAP